MIELKHYPRGLLTAYGHNALAGIDTEGRVWAVVTRHNGVFAWNGVPGSTALPARCVEEFSVQALADAHCSALLSIFNAPLSQKAVRRALYRECLRQLRRGGQPLPAVASSFRDAAAKVYAMRSRCHDQLVDAPAFLGDPAWVQKSLSRFRRASIATYPTRLPA